MLPGDASTSPLSLRDRIVIALDQLRIARDNGSLDEEIEWQNKLDELLDAYPR